MASVGSPNNPLRVAIIGAGPAGFYSVAHLLKLTDITVEADIYDRLPTPFGLVRFGVAPDHQKDKSVTRVYDRSGSNPQTRFYGGVEYGKHLGLQELKRLYHQIIFTCGASEDRNLNIPGETLNGNYSATEFVGWYNGHPDFADRQFDLSQETVVIVGVGNVAIDVARVLSTKVADLATTDIADHALVSLRQSKVRNIILLGRRGPAQAAFTPVEIKELAALDDVQLIAEAAELDPLSQKWLVENGNKQAQQNVALLQEYAGPIRPDSSKQIHLKFWTSPIALHGNRMGMVEAMSVQTNQPQQSDNGSICAAPTEQKDRIHTGLVFRSVGYQGMPLPDLPFNEKTNTLPHHQGRLIDQDRPCPGLYTAGWIKRGATGVIGTNKTCAKETVTCMLEDLAAGKHLMPETPSAEAAHKVVTKHCPEHINYDGWLRIDAEEMRCGEKDGRPRVKFTRIQEMLAVAKDS